MADKVRRVVFFVIALLFPLQLFAATATLTWTDNSNNEDGFVVGRKLAGQTWEEIATVSTNVTTYKDEAAQEGACYVVAAFNDTGRSDPSNEACVPILPFKPSDLKMTVTIEIPVQ